ncbi:MAG: HAMP domain-containing histidine kinase [Candidatus Yonathbacteria bacterium]|nr:HAMP domain-containing histidine kinase [Candidatus Yonathbacteria bacterium]
MIGSIFDIINNISLAGLGVVISSFFAALLCGVIFWQDVTKQRSLLLFLFGIVNALAALAYAFLGDSLGTSVAYAGMIMLYIASSVAPVFLFVKYNLGDIKIIAIELFISITVLVLAVELFFADSLLDLFIKTGITVLVVFASSFLVRSVKREIQSQDQIACFSHNLDITRERLRILDKKKSEFISIVARDLLGPLTAINGYASTLARGSFGELSRPIQEAVEKIFISSGHLVAVVSDFVDILRIESGDMKYNFTDVDMKKLVLSVANETKRVADSAHLTFNTTIDDSAPLRQFITVGDENKLRQVILNLIDNSIKYTPHGEVSLLLRESPDKKKILFSLSDTGIGMSPSTLGKIFRKFSRAEQVNTVYTESISLGLYVAKEIVDKHAGRIWAESKGEGMGSTFFVELAAKP